MNFTTKLHSGFGIILMVVLLLLASIMNTLSKLNDHVEQIVANRYTQVKLASTLPGKTPKPPMGLCKEQSLRSNPQH